MKHFAIALGLCLSVSTGAAAEIRYSVSGIQTVDGYADNIWGINNSGAVTGSFRSGSVQEAFAADGVNVVRLGTGGQASGLGRTINDKGIVGGIFGSGADARAFLSNGVTTFDLTSLNPAAAGAGVIDINNNGTALLYGFVFTPGPNPSFSLKNFLFDGNSLIDLLSPQAAPIRIYLAINDANVVSGAQSGSSPNPFLSDGTSTLNLPSVAGGLVGSAIALNEASWATGATSWSDGNTAFLFNGVGTINLGSLRSTPSDALLKSLGNDLNDFGVVVGRSLYDGGSGDHAFIYGGSIMEDLNGLIDPASGWVLTAAQGINNAGQIVGVGTFNGQQRGFILNPLAAVPEPASWAMMIGGFAIVGAGLRRRARVSVHHAIA